MSPDLNPIEHIWDMLGLRIQAREPPVQNIRQLEAALHRESQQDIRRLTGGCKYHEITDQIISRTQW
jgi:transposase